MDEYYRHFHAFPLPVYALQLVNNHIKLSGRVAHTYVTITLVIMQQLCTSVSSIPSFSCLIVQSAFSIFWPVIVTRAAILLERCQLPMRHSSCEAGAKPSTDNALKGADFWPENAPTLVSHWESAVCLCQAFNQKEIWDYSTGFGLTKPLSIEKAVYF